MKAHLPEIARALKKIAVMLLVLPILIAVRLVRPLILIRFGPLRADRIGDFTFHTEIYLCGRDLGIHDPRALDIFYCQSKVSNQFLKKMWQRTMHIYQVAGWLDRLNRWIPGGNAHQIPASPKEFQNRDVEGVLARVPPHLSFTVKEENTGQENLQAMGVPPNSPIICFIARDSAYLDSVFPEIVWGYHDYRDSDIENYVLAAKKLTQRGYYLLRMGSVVNQPLETSENSVIDYATQFRSEFLDMYLGNQCRFLITNECGYANVSQIFRRPIVWTNMPAIEFVHTWMSNQIFIPKKLWNKREQRLLTIQEILDSGIGRSLTNDKIDPLGIKLIDNTAEEISAVALEMDDRLSGTWIETEEDEYLQTRFRELFASSDQHGQIVSRIGAEFLRQNKEILD